MKRTGTSPTANLVGSIEYEHISIRFNTVQELDQVELTGTTKKTRPVGVVGGGVRIPLSERIGLRADARVHFSANRDETFVSATPPTRTAGGTAGYYEIGVDPSIQIQTSAQLPDSEVSFSGPPISNFRTFQGTGIETNINVTFGAFWRF